MTELLAPAGNFDALEAAISNGADAIYLGLNKYGARAYANNFSIEELKKAVEYAHLRNVKIYVTMNTIIYDNELKDAYNQIKDVYLAGVDGIIVQDLSLLNHITENYPDLEAHSSTQMGIDDLEGTLLMKKLNSKRVVLSREVEIEKIKEIKKISKMPIEIFIHGALCVSYSGNCLMSGLIGYRSGNRGRCVGSCRKEFELIDTTNNITYPKSYILSMKDLNTSYRIDELKDIDSLKIEGRMKESVYVANVVKAYRELLDNKKADKIKINKDLTKTFNRTYTKGYIFHEDKKDITNILKPNNFGFEIGKISKKNNLGYEIKLIDELNQGDIIRINHNGEDVNLTASRIYDNKGNLINSSNSYCFIDIKEKLNIGDIVYKTKDVKYHNELESTYPKVFKRIPLDVAAYGNVGSKLSLTLTADGKSIHIESDFILDKALKNPTDEEQFIKQFSRLGDTVYTLNDVTFMVADSFIPSGKLNELRRLAIELLNKERLGQRIIPTFKDKKYEKLNISVDNKQLAVYCNTLEQYNAAKDAAIKVIYYKDNVIRRNQVKYDKVHDKDMLIGGYGGIYASIKNNQSYVTDFSLNVVNSEAVYTLHSLGAKRVCISHEINKSQIDDIISSYNKKVGQNPNLEMIVYGKADMLFTKYCPLKKFNLCGKCKENKYVIKDEYGQFPILSHEDCTTTILNGKNLNLIDDLESINGINTYRIQLTTEDYNESLSIINMFKDKLSCMNKTSLFNKETDTRGHFNKEIL
jgi:putative protease